MATQVAASQRHRTGRGRPVVTIRSQVGRHVRDVPVAATPALVRVAEEWNYLLRARPRWADDADLKQSMRARALEALGRLGIDRRVMRRLASATHIEVELHPWDATDATASRLHEAASEIPWEYLISASTRCEGRLHPMLITRLFRNDGPAVLPAPPSRVLFVESAPGRLRDEYDFGSERVRIGAAVGVPVEEVKTPQVSELRREVRTQAWDVVHVTGVDTHQVTRYPALDGLYEDLATTARSKVIDADGRVRDGMILREGHVAELPVNYVDLADTLIDPAHPPSLVTLNLYHSGARTARELVRRGAHAAMGFLDEIDDELAELFFQAFYWAWCRPDGAVAIPHAFVEAWQSMADDRLHGTSIIIWMGRSVFDAVWAAERTARTPTSAAAPPPAHAPTTLPVDQLLQVEVDVDPEINYSLLHNDRPLLNKLTLTKLVTEPLEDITVQVELNLGTQNYPFRYTHLRLTDAQLGLGSLVKIPLTASLPRSLRERVQSTVYVKVTCGGRTAHESTERVTLIPVDEWYDDTNNNPWLPSFVLPRDPAVVDIIRSARRYLIGIEDDPSAGFDGYQAVDPKADVPTANVDAQVRAIWTAIVNDFRLQYINPPPAYSDRTQRLRTPSDIVSSNSGTCIDLALLLASCLEYVDIYPVVVLLSGHAFVGYWRTDEAHGQMVGVERIPAEVAAVGSRFARAAGVPYVDRFGWRLTALNYHEIMAYVAAGDLVMLEATYLTSASSFADAVTEGRANMRSRREFDSLLDVRLARTSWPPVTPLPILAE